KRYIWRAGAAEGRQHTRLDESRDEDLTSRSKGGMETLMSPLDQAFHEAGAKLHGHGPVHKLSCRLLVVDILFSQL
ncbi:hypothetical protein XENORESO_015971, partial [Xenotaenia resolanae]